MSPDGFTFLAGTEVLGSQPGWTFDQSGDGSDRSFRHYVAFQQSFRFAPLVHLGIAGFDIANQDAARLTATTANVTPQGFEIVLSTWLHTRLWRVDINWLALGP
jgi:hypothetical protein